MQFNKGAEIGIRAGRFSELLCRTNPNLELLCIDPWIAYSRVGKKRQQKYAKIAAGKLANYNTKIMHMTSIEAIPFIENDSLDFVYIDADHNFDAIIMDLIHWNKKVKKGGIISGHDYFHFNNAGVVFAINAYTRAHSIKDWYVTSEKMPSWFWVK